MNPIDDFEERGFLQRHGFALGVAGMVLIAVFVVMGRSLLTGQSTVQHKAAEVTIVRVAPPPPPPPPPPPQTVQEQKMLEQPKDSLEEPPDEPTPVVGTSIQGKGPADGFGVSANANRNLTSSAGKKTGNPFGSYAAQVQATISDALRKDPRTRSAEFRVEVRIWPDLTGRVTRASLVSSTGDPAIDTAIKTDVLTGLQLDASPPEGMPLPIVIRLTARRPN